MHEVYLAKNRYKLVNVLGAGGMAIVFKAEDTRLKVEKAIKIPNHQCLSHPVIRDRFETEASTMAKLRHKNIVIIYDIIDEEHKMDDDDATTDIVYMVMEMLPGGSLKDRIDEFGPLHPQQVITATNAMLSGLGFAHQNNVVHRDVKVENMLVGPNDELKVSDFGIAQIDGGSGMTRTGATMGTLAFMAPEQKLNSKKATFLSDLYSAGASFFNMLTGKNPSELYALDIQETAFNGLADGTIEFLQKACHMNPKERFQSADEMIQALEDLRDIFEPLPENATPFYVAKEDTEDSLEDLEYRQFKIGSVWNTQISPPTLHDFRKKNRTIPPQNSSATINFDEEESTANPTSLEDLGIDLMGDVTGEVTGSHSVETLLPPQNQPAQQTNTSPVEPEPPQKKGFPVAIVGVIAALLIGGGVFAFSQTNSNETNEPTEQVKQPEKEKQFQEEQQKLALAKKDVKPISNTEAGKLDTPEEKNTEAKVGTKKEVVPVKKTEVKTTSSKPKTTKTAPKEEVKVAPPVEEVVKSNKKGSIVFLSKPWSNIKVDGKAAKCKNKSTNNTPCAVELPVGSHKISFQSGTDTSMVRTKSITIKEGQNSNICWDIGTNARCN